MPPIHFAVDRREAGKTLAAVLKLRYGLSWAQAKRLVERGHVRVSGQLESDVARRLKLGKRVEIAAGAIEVKRAEKPAVKRPEPPKSKPQPKEKPHPKPAAARAPALDPDCIVFADEAIVVVNKPAGLTTVRSSDDVAEFGTHGQRFLTKTLAGMLPLALGAPNKPVIPVHRLDRDTSGLVVFARTKAAGENLLKQFRKHSTERRYLALTRGTPEAKKLESVFVRDRGDGRRGSTTDLIADDGKRAVTRVSVREVLGKFALVECRLETGRTHQVRIHLGEAGAPLCGETVYDRAVNGAPKPDGSGADRPMLHAARLGFTHPETGEAMNWDVPPPEDFAALLKELRAR